MACAAWKCGICGTRTTELRCGTCDQQRAAAAAAAAAGGGAGAADASALPIKRMRLLAQGGESQVELCVWRQQLVALKTIKRRDGGDSGTAERAALEAVGATRCPLVVELLDALACDDVPDCCLVLRLAVGGPLYAHVRAAAGGRFGMNRAAFYAAEVAAGLDALHASGFAHRDLKASNVLLSGAGHAVLCDLGHARRFATLAERSVSWVGTPHAMAPEVVLREGHSTAVDWWGLGVLIFEMLTGRFPFATAEGGGDAMWCEGAEARLALPADVVAADASSACSDVVFALLRRDPDQRLCGAAALLRERWFTSRGWSVATLHALEHAPPVVMDSALRLVDEAEEAEALDGDAGGLTAAEEALFEGF